jgi:hypothetical protein
MALIPHAAVGDKITAAKYNTLVDVANAQGLTLIDPTSVTGSGSSISSLGTVNLSACAAATINGVFTSAYSNYRIVINVGLSAADGIFGHLAVGGTPDTTSNYDTQKVLVTGTTPSGAQVTAAPYWSLAAAGTTVTQHNVVIDLFGPAIATPCTGVLSCLANTVPMTTAAATATGGIANRLSTAFDGFELNTNAGTMTGTVQIFGYNAG